MDIVRIVIPVYKTQLDANERMSLVRSLSILKNHPFSIVCPEHLDLADLEPLFIGVNYDIRRFNAHFFDGIMGYNCLMLSPIFLPGLFGLSVHTYLPNGCLCFF